MLVVFSLWMTTYVPAKMYLSEKSFHKIKLNRNINYSKSYVQSIMSKALLWKSNTQCIPSAEVTVSATYSHFTSCPFVSADWCNISEKIVYFMWLFNELFQFPSVCCSHMIMNQCAWITHINITNRYIVSTVITLKGTVHP